MATSPAAVHSAPDPRSYVREQPPEPHSTCSPDVEVPAGRSGSAEPAARDRIVVDGETFLITRRHPGGNTYDFSWVGGRHNGDYGFSSTTFGTPDRDPMTEGEMRSSVADFLAQVDPGTGFIE